MSKLSVRPVESLTAEAGAAFLAGSVARHHLASSSEWGPFAGDDDSSASSSDDVPGGTGSECPPNRTGVF